MKNVANETPMDDLHGRTRWICENINRDDVKDKTVLNIGCGFGWFEYRFRDIVKEMHGLEPTEEGLSTAKRYIDDPKVVFELGNALNLPYRESLFDTVVAWDVIEHIPKNTEIEMLNEISRVLKPGGKCYLSTPYRSIINNLLDPAWLLTGHRHYSKSFFINSVNVAEGLAVEDLFVRGGIWTQISMLNLYVAKWIFKRKPFCSEFFNRKEDRQWLNEGGNNTLFIILSKKI